MHALKRLLPFFHQLLLSFECLEDPIYLSTQEREIYGVVFFVTREIFVFVADQVELYSIFHHSLFHIDKRIRKLFISTRLWEEAGRSWIGLRLEEVWNSWNIITHLVKSSLFVLASCKVFFYASRFLTEPFYRNGIRTSWLVLSRVKFNLPLSLSLSFLFKNMYTADITYDIARAYAISLGDSSNKIYHHRPFHFSFRAFNYSLRRGFFSASRKTREKRTTRTAREWEGQYA